MHEPLSPELALVDPDLGARARAALPDRVTSPRPRAVALPPEPAAAVAPVVHVASHRPYPLWARVTAALWLVVIGILIGGAAIPHAQDTPRVVPTEEDAQLCPRPQVPAAPLGQP